MGHRRDPVRSEAHYTLWGTIGSAGLEPGPDWYGADHVTFFESLQKPAWIPPDWAFPTVWFSLWFLQGIALLVIVDSERNGRSTAAVLLVLQFVVAIAWQAVVFGPGRLAFAAWWLVAVLVLVVGAALSAWRVAPLAGLLIAPTVVWVSIATALGFSLLRLNPGV